MSARKRRRLVPEYRPEYRALFEEHVKHNSRTSFAGRIGVQEWVLYEWARKYPEFRKVFMAAKPKIGSWYAS